MKTTFYSFVLLLFATGVFAQADTARITPKRNYINLAYDHQKNIFDKGALPPETFKSWFGIAAEMGVTYFINEKNPASDMLYFGIDLSYLDIQFNSFKMKDTDEGGNSRERFTNFANLGIQIGPSLTIMPRERVAVNLFIHYAPSVAAYALPSYDYIYYGYAGYLTLGAKVTLRYVSLGVETRYTETKLSYSGGNVEIKSTNPLALKIPNTRVILGFRF